MGSPGCHPREKKAILSEILGERCQGDARTQNKEAALGLPPTFSQASGTEALSVARHLVNVVVCLPTRDAR